MSIKGSAGVKNLRKRAAAHLYAKRWRTVSTGAEVVIVSGPYGKRTAAMFLKHVFESQGQTVLTHEHVLLGAEDVQRVLHDGRKDKVDVIIICLEDSVLETQPLGPVVPKLLVVPSVSTTEMARKRHDWANPLKYVYGLQLGEYPLENPEDSNLAFGEGSRVDAVIKDFKLYRKGTELALTIDHQTKLEVATHLIGRVNVDTVSAVIASIYVLHRPIEGIEDLIADIEYVDGNYEIIAVVAPFAVAIDSAPDDYATEQVVESAHTLAKRRLIVVVEAAQVSEECIDRLVGQADRLIVVDVNDLKRDKSGVDRLVSPDAAYRKVVQVARQDDLVVLIGDSFVKRDDSGQPIALAALAHAMESR